MEKMGSQSEYLEYFPVSSEISYFQKLFQQFVTMLKRNFILQVIFINNSKLRNSNSIFVQTILAPIIFLLLLFSLQQASYFEQSIGNLNPSTSELEGIYRCQVNFNLS